MTEATLRSVLRHLPHDPSRIPSGDLERFLRISDKATVLATAGEAGIAVPAQWTVERKAQVGTILDSDLPMPVVVKPGRSVARAVDGGMLKTSVQHARDRGELRRILNGLPTSAFPVLLQQRVTGPGVGVFLLVWEGRLLARFAHRRLREKPPSGGVSVYRESTAMDPALLDRSVDLLRRFEWDGVAMVEYKVDASTGTPYLMEINPRFWGSLQLAIDAGVDFPRLLVSAARGQPVEGPEDYRTGVRSRWWWGDIDHLLIRLKGSTETLHLPPDAGGVASAVWDFLHLWRPGDRSEVLRLSDPRPILRETRLWFRS
jgi:predicted ATP-grasp superfamily ATP-dependent carboligase